LLFEVFVVVVLIIAFLLFRVGVIGL